MSRREPHGALFGFKTSPRPTSTDHRPVVSLEAKSSVLRTFWNRRAVRGDERDASGDEGF
jgi:hypothetical protein